MRRLLLAALPPTLSLLVAMAAASLLILLYGAAPIEVYRVFFAGTWGHAYGIGQVLFKATPLILTGLSVAVAFRGGLFNVGAEGQATGGAFAMALLGAALPPSTSPWLALPACLAAGFLAGALLGAIPGLLKRRGAHEVIVTIMLNFVVLAGLADLGKRFYLRESVHTAPVVDGAALPRVASAIPAFAGSAVNLSLLLALLAAVVVWLFVEHSRPGFRLRVVGHRPEAAASAGIHVGRQLLLAMAVAGGLAGLVGANAVLGYKRYYEEGFAGGVGFVGIAVALLGRHRPVGIVVAALLFGTLSQGGLAINALVPKELVDVLQALIILAVAVTGELVRRVAEREAGGR